MEAFVTLTGAGLIYPQKLAEAADVNVVIGQYTIEEALDVLLEGTGFSGGLTSGGTIVVSLVKTKTQDREGTVNSGKIKKGLLASVSAFLFGAGGHAVAQDDVAAAANGGERDTIIVTATKRETSLQETPASIRAFSQEQIERASIVGMGDYLATVPGVSQADFGVANNRVSIRGIGASLTDETTVGVYLGEVSLTSIGGWGLASTVDAKLVDIERIEVLRGPQGTLFGSGSIGGAVRNIPNAPNLEEFEAELQAGISTTDGADGANNKVTGVINVPLVRDQLALRITGYRFQNQGYVNMVPDPGLDGVVGTFGGVVNVQDGVNDTEYYGVRASLLWQPIDELSATLAFGYQDLEQEGIALLNGNGTFERIGLGLNGAYGEGVEEGRTDEFSFTNLVIEYDLGWGDILSSSTLSNRDYSRRIDFSPLFGIPGALENEVEAEGFTQEVRLASRLGGPIQFLAGFYYEDLENAAPGDTVWTGDQALNIFGTPTRTLDDGVLDIGIKQTAFFGELSYDITEKLNLTLGGRWFDYDRELFQDRIGVLFGPAFADVESSEDGTIGKANLSYAPNDSTLLYAQWAQGFRLGRPTQVSPVSFCDADGDGILDGTSTPYNADGIIDSDSLDSFELGGKLGLADNRVVINGALYRIEWDDLPVRVSNPTFTCATELNAGKARSQGLEFEANVFPIDDLRLDFGLGYVNAELSEDAEGLGSEGDRLPFTPKFNASFGIDYSFDLSGHESFLNIRYAYVGGSHTDFAEMSPEMGDYSKVDIRAGMAVNDHVDVEVYGTNITNSDELTFVYAFGNYRQTPRQIGLDVRVRY